MMTVREAKLTLLHEALEGLEGGGSRYICNALNHAYVVLSSNRYGDGDPTGVLLRARNELLRYVARSLAPEITYHDWLISVAGIPTPEPRMAQKGRVAWAHHMIKELEEQDERH